MEKKGDVSKSNLSDPKSLGELVKEKFDSCEYEEEFDYSKQKKSDWPAYQASSIKTIKEFERQYIWYRIRGANEYNITYIIESPNLSNDVHLTKAFTMGTDAVGIVSMLSDFHRFFQKVENVK